MNHSAPPSQRHSSLAHPSTAGRVRAMDARCGLSTLGPWAGPVICNEWKVKTQHGERFRQCERAALLCNYNS